MRNLQKILALVLALIMSFSLVATAGAFSDDGDISEAYQDAVEVLNGLGVFKGYEDGSFQPKGNITRAEVAAIIYRIATGDVTNSQNAIYSTYGQFTDVADASWYSGYVNYCANAGYIKGRGNKIFDPQSQVTGYEALAMILRAVGYDKNGEFTGSNWQIRTASIANEKDITKNVTSAQLGQPATRETVAEILFRSIVIPKVNFNANTLSYTEKPLNADGKKDTLAYESLKLEEITGVVTANEYADLEATEPLSADRTRLDVNGTDYTLEYKTTLDDIGESRIAYVQNLTGSKIVNNVMLLSDTDDNVVYDEGKKIDTKDAAAEKGIKLRDDTTLYFVNYDPIDEYRADWRIEYVYTWKTNTYSAVEKVRNNDGTLKNLTNGEEWKGSKLEIKDLNELKDLDRTREYEFEYRKTIKADDFLTATDIDLIKEIFSEASYTGNAVIKGEVYVGTTSIQKTDDVSDEISYREFVNTYLTLADNKEVVDENTRGNRLKVIDNNNDGVVEYVLQTKYTVTTVSELKSDGSFVLETKNDPLDAKDVVNEVDNDTKFVKEDGSADLALNDVVLYAVIDGNARTEKAETLNAKIDKVNRTNGEVTTTDGTTYEDSDICAHAEHYNDNPKEMAGSTNYNLYLDKYGYLAAFNEAEESFALLVDGWYNRVKGGDEYAVKTWQDGKLQTVDVTANGDLFIGDTESQNNDWDQIRTLDRDGGTLNNGNQRDGRNDVHTSVAMLSSDGVLTPVDMAYHTLKQTVMIDMFDNQLPDRDGEQGRIYTTRANAANRTAYNVPGVDGDADVDVRALSSTVYYFVYNALSGSRTITQVVREYVGYQNLPAIDEKNGNDYTQYIEDVYAVGTRQTSSVNKPYCTAEVVVVELNDNYYNSLGGEQVFIPRFPVVGTNVTREEVQLVREDGTLEEVTIDLNRSDLRYYDIAEGTGTHARGRAIPGLYRMWRVSDSDTYYVHYMTADEIAKADRYYVGMVDYDEGTGARNYTVIDTFGRDGDEPVAATTFGETGKASALNLNSTKYYTYKDDELTESNRAAVMIQTPTADIRRTDTCGEWQNETQTYKGYQRNEVLIAYDKADNGEERIAYAISFNEYDDWDGPAKEDHVHDNAQLVWFHCLPYKDFGPVTDPDAADKQKVADAKTALNGMTFTPVVVPYTETDAQAFVISDIVKQANDAQNSLVITPADVTIDDLTGLTSTPINVAVTIALKSGTISDSAAGSVNVSKENAPVLTDTVKVKFGFYTMTPVEIDVKGTSAADGKVTLTAQNLIDAFKAYDAEHGNAFAALTLSIYSVDGVEGAGPWTVDPTKTLAVELDAENGADVQSSSRTARSAARAGNDLQKLWIMVKIGEGKTLADVDFTKTMAMGFLNENGDELSKDELKALLEKGTLRNGKIAIETYARKLPTGKWSCYWQFPPVYNNTQSAGTVSVSVGKLTGKGAEMTIKSVKDDITSWVSSTRLPIVDGVVTVEVRYTETTPGKNVPIVADEQTTKFEPVGQSNNYIAQIPAQDGDVIELTDITKPRVGSELEVTLTPSSGVTILGAGKDGQKTVQLASGTGKAIFTVTVPAGAEPRVTNLKSNNAAFSGAAATQTKISGNTWKIVLDVTGLTKPLTGDIIVLPTAPTVTVTEADATRAKLAVNPTTGTATGGTFTFDVYVLQGNEPVFQNLGGATYEANPVGGDFQGNMQKWTVVLNNVNGNLNVSVTGVPYQTLKITGVGKSENLVLKSGEEDGVRVSDGKAEFTVYLKPGARALADVDVQEKQGTRAKIVDVTITAVASIQIDNEMWAGWHFELENVPNSLIATSFKVQRHASNNQETVRVFAPVETGISPKEQIVYSTQNGSAKIITFTVKTSGDTVPFIEDAELKKIHGGRTSPEMTITKTDTVDEWEIEIKGASIASGDVNLCAKYMPVVNTTISGSGVSLVSSNNVPATVIRDSSGQEWYTQTFTYDRANNTQLSVGTVQVNGQDAKNCKTSVVETTDGYRVTVMVARNGRGTTGTANTDNDKIGTIDLTRGSVSLTNAVASEKPVSITLPVTGVTGYRIELTEDSRFTVISDGGKNYQYVPSGSTGNFTIQLNGNYSVDRGEGYEVSTHTGTGGIVVTVPDVTSDKTITLNIRDISGQGNVYYEGTAYGNIANIDSGEALFWTNDGGTVNGTWPNATGKKSGYLINGEGSWRIGAEMNYVPRVIATYANGNRDVTEECIGIRFIRTEWSRPAGQPPRTIWEVTVKATESVHLDFDLIPVITSTENDTFGHGQILDNQVRGLGGEIYAGIRLNTSSTTNQKLDNSTVSYLNVNFQKVVPVSTIYSPEKKTIPFYVLVNEDCEIRAAEVTGDSTIPVDVSEGRGYTLGVPTGYRAVLITVNVPVDKLNTGADAGTYTGDVELRAVYNK